MIAALFWLSATIIVYVYAGYPALLAGLGPLVRRRRPAPPSRRPKLRLVPDPRSPCGPTISCIVPALDEELTIEAKIANLTEELDGRRFEIIVVDDGSTDATAAKADGVDDPRVRVISHDERTGKPVALNDGVAAATGSILVLSDADVFLKPGSITSMLDRLDEDGVGIVGAGRVLQGDDDGLASSDGLYWRYEQFIQDRESELGACVAMSGSVLVMRRDSFAPLPADIINDDFYLAMHVLGRGEQALHEPGAAAVVGVAPDAAAERRRRERIVAGRWQAIGRGRQVLPLRRPMVMWEVCSHKLLRPIVPFAFFAAMFAALLALLLPRRSGSLFRLRGPMRGAPLLGQLAFLAMAAVGSRMQGRNRFTRLLYLPSFLVGSNRAAVAGLVGYLTGRQSARWERETSPYQSTPDRPLTHSLADSYDGERA